MRHNTALLELDVVCHECKKKPINCECEDKWFRLHLFKIRLLSAEFAVGCGSASASQYKLYDKFNKYV